jgi:hypothetical protein
MAEKNALRESRDGRFVTVITDKKASGKVGSYEVRTADSGRFIAAKRAANTALRSAEIPLRRK